MKEIKLYKSRWKAIKLLLLTIPFVIGGIFLIQTGETSYEKMIGWLCTGFFGLGIPIFFYQLFDTKNPQIILNEIGIFDKTIHAEFINWEIIEDAYLLDVHGQKFISLVIDEAFEPSKKKGKKHKLAAKLNKSMGFQELNVNLGMVKIDEIRLTQFILAMTKAEKSQRVELVKELEINRKS